MSIEQTISSLKRAKSACDEAKAPATKRGMFALVERRHRYMTLLAGGLSEHDTFTPGIVSSVDRAGMVKEVRCTGNMMRRRRDWDFCHIDSRGLVVDPAAVCAALVDAFGLPQHFSTQAEAVVAIRAAVKL